MEHMMSRFRKARLVAWFTLAFFVGQPMILAADLVIDPNNKETRIDQAPNGTPIVQIAGPNGQGISHNRYQEFNVGPNGLILNNGLDHSNTQLAGWIEKNQNMARGSARVILNEVTGGNISRLNGYIEVAGMKSDVVIANPNGIVGSGFGFINTSRATLTTGQPMIGGNGALTGFDVSGGQIAIEGTGMNAYGADRVDLLSRAIQVNAEIYGNELNAVSGTNKIDYATGEVSAYAGDPLAKPTVGIDVAALGGMYVGRIRLVGTELGVGVNSAGALSATGGDLVVTSEGKVVLSGQTYGKGNITITAKEDIENSNTVYSQGNTTLTADGKIVSQGTLATGGDMNLVASDISSDGVLGAGVKSDGSLSTSGNLTIAATGKATLHGQNLAGGNLSLEANKLDMTGSETAAGKDVNITVTGGGLDHSNNQLLADGNVTITVAGALKNVGGKIIARENLTLNQTDRVINNQGGTLGAGQELTITAKDINNQDGLIGSDGDLTLTAKSLTGGGKVLAGQDGTISLTTDFVQETTGEVRAGRELTVSSTGRVENSGKLLAGEAVTINAKGFRQETTGVLSGPMVTVTAQNNLNNLGSIEGSYVELTGTTVKNSGGVFGDVIQVTGTTIENNKGVIAASDSIALYATDSVSNKADGFIWAGETLWIAGSSEVDENGYAVKRVGLVLNESSILEAGSLIGIFTDELTNKRTKFKVAKTTTKTSHKNDLPFDSWMNRDYSDDPHGTKKKKQKYLGKWEEYVQTEVQEYVTADTTAASEIRSGKDILIQAETVTNSMSHIMAVDVLDLDDVGTLNNEGYELTKTTTIDGNIVRHRIVKTKHTIKPSSYKEYKDKTPIYDQQIEVTGTVNAVVGGGQTVVIDAVTINNGNLDEAGNPISNGLANKQTSDAGFTLPSGGLYKVNTDPSSKYLVETDSRFTSFKNFISSDYMLDRLLWDPGMTQKRLGDGFYEQQLIRDQVANLTGKYFLGDYTDANDQYLALMTAGAEFATEFSWQGGIALTAEQMSKLTTDIVWLEERVVEGQKVLVPVVYLAKVRDQEMTAGGSIISGNQVVLNVKEAVNNGGVITGTNGVSIQAGTILNRGEIVSSGNLVNLKAEGDIRNESGRIAGDSVQIIAGGDFVSTTTTHKESNGKVETTRFDKIASIESKNDTVIIADKNVQIDGTLIQAGGDIRIKAGDDLSIGAVTYESKQLGGGYARGGSETLNLVSGVQAGGNVQLQAGDELHLSGTQVTAGDSIVIKAGGDIRIDAVKDSSIEGHYGLSKRRFEDEAVVGSKLVAENTVMIRTDENINIKGSQVSSNEGLVGIQAGKDVTIESENELHKSDYETKYSGGGLLSKMKVHMIDNVEMNLAVGSAVTGNEMIIDAGQNLTVSGSQILATKDVVLNAGGNLNIVAAKESIDEYHLKSIKKSGILSGGPLAVTIGTEKEKTTQWSGQEGYVSSTIGSIEGDILMTAGKDVNVVASNVRTLDGDINIQGENVNIVAAVGEGDSHYRYEYEKTGLTIGLGGMIIDPLKSAYDYANVSDNAQTDELKYAAGAKAIWEARNAVQDFNKIMKVGQTDPTKALQNAISINVSIGSQKMSAKQDSTSQTIYGSDIAANGNVQIIATGKLQGENEKPVGGDINLVASTISGDNVTLKANEDVNILAGQNTENMTGSNKSSGWSLGASWSLAGTFGGIDVSVSGGKGKSSGQIVENIESTISARDKLTIESGNDTNIVGSQVYGETVKMDIGGDLNIESLQDIDNYKEKNTNWSAGLTDQGTFARDGNGDRVKKDEKDISLGGASGGYSKQAIDSDYKSVQEQAGIYAGSGGFDITVGGNTDLKGAVIDSDAGSDKNKLSTDTITYSDIHNEAEWSAETKGINYASGAGVENKDKGLTPNFAGSEGEDSSTTKSAIAPGEIEIRSDESKEEKDKTDLTGLSRAPDKANDPLKPIFDKDKILEKQQAAALVGEIGFTLVGKLSEELGWKDGSAEKVLLHGLIGGLMAEINGGKFGDGLTTAAINEMVIGLIADHNKDLRLEVSDVRWITAILGGIISEETGGGFGQGASIADSATKNNYGNADKITDQLTDLEDGEVIPPDGTEERLESMIGGSLHFRLDIIGMIPGLELADGLNAIIYIVEGEYSDATLSAMGMIPFVGTIATGGKYGQKAYKIVDEAKFLSKTDELLNVYPSIKYAPKYPDGFQSVQNGVKKVAVNNTSLLDDLRKIEPGEWKKVYQNGYDNAGNQVSVHYFQHTKSGKVFDVKTKDEWSTGW